MRVEFLKNQDFKTAQQELAKVGVILTNRQHPKGGYICHLSGELKIAYTLIIRLYLFIRQGRYGLSGRIC